MKVTKLIGASAIAAIAILSVPGAASAGHITGACADELNAVEAAIGEAIFTGRRAEMDQTNMLAKLDAADAKVDLGKYADAVDKLLDISDKATALANAPKAKLEDATGINGAVSAAMICVGGLGG